MISVIIPLYNKEQTIKTTIYSLLNQTFDRFEIIVVNDGSTDNSLKIIETINDDRIHIFNKTNSGVSDARNFGVSKANFNWIALLDGDDIKHPNTLSEYFYAIEKYKKFKLFSTGYSIVTKTETKRYTNKYLPEDGKTDVIDLIDCMSVGNLPVNSSNSLFHISLFDKTGGFKKGQKNYEDHDLWLRMYENNSIVFINKDLLYVRRDLQNTARLNLIKYSDLLSFLNTIYLTKKRLTNSEKEKFKKYYNRFFIWIMFKTKYFYTKQEKKNILLQMKKIVNFYLYVFLRMINI